MKKTKMGLPKFETEQELINYVYERVENGVDVSYKYIDTTYRFMSGNNQLDLLDISFEKFLSIFIDVLMDEYRSAQMEVQ